MCRNYLVRSQMHCGYESGFVRAICPRQGTSGLPARHKYTDQHRYLVIRTLPLAVSQKAAS